MKAVDVDPLTMNIDPAKVEKLRAGQSYIGHISPERIAALRDSGRSRS